jgi:hypothetical protein
MSNNNVPPFALMHREGAVHTWVPRFALLHCEGAPRFVATLHTCTK